MKKKVFMSKKYYCCFDLENWVPVQQQNKLLLPNVYPISELARPLFFPADGAFSVDGASWTLNSSKETVNCNKTQKNKFTV